MASHERNGLTDEWYTPAWIFEKLGVTFDLDPCNAAVNNPAFNWCAERYVAEGLDRPWRGSVWLNPPFGGRNGIRPWLEKMATHDNGIAIVPNRTATDWFQDFARHAGGLLLIHGKVKFIRPDGTEGRSPGYGNVLIAYGRKMAHALYDSEIRGLRL